MFRSPTTTAEENLSFYQNDYRSGATTREPNVDELRALTAAKFRGHRKDFSRYIALLAALGARQGQRVLDFGCSWGYGSWQLTQAGYRVSGYEISKPRCSFAREKLAVAAHHDLEAVGDDGTFDVFFSSHVLEHAPSVAAVIAYARRKLKPDGLSVAITPNGSDGFRAANPDSWGKSWGLVHPNLLDDVFFRQAFPRCLLAASPFDPPEIGRRWKSNLREVPALDGRELMVATHL